MQDNYVCYLAALEIHTYICILMMYPGCQRESEMSSGHHF